MILHGSRFKTSSKTITSSATNVITAMHGATTVRRMSDIINGKSIKRKTR